LPCQDDLPHAVYDNTYINNSKQVINIIAEITQANACWNYVKPAQADLDGCAAYKALYDHSLGRNSINVMATKADQTLQTIVYNGEQRCWDFEKFVNLHLQQHLILEDLVKHIIVE
jgi:hypothetical protein